MQGVISAVCNSDSRGSHKQFFSLSHVVYFCVKIDWFLNDVFRKDGKCNFGLNSSPHCL